MVEKRKNLMSGYQHFIRIPNLAPMPHLSRGFTGRKINRSMAIQPRKSIDGLGFLPITTVSHNFGVIEGAKT